MTTSADALVSELRLRAEALGFDAFGIAPADARPELAARLAAALDANWHAEMDWLQTTAERRASPQAMWADARSVLMVAMSYAPAEDPLPLLKQKSIGNISVYARNRDYHDLIKGRLKELAGILARRSGAEVKVFVDTAPLMEKPLAEAAGLGWQGKHTVLVSRRHGSWLFLGAILTSAELPADTPHEEMCGTCSRCLDICPTNAFPAPFQLDSRKCLAYLNNEHKGHIPRTYRLAMGNRVFGCDDCLAVCPWNKFAAQTHETRLRARMDLAAPPLADLLALDDAGFRQMFAGSPVKRIGHARFLRNVLIAAGNSEDDDLIEPVQARITDPAAIVRAAAIWAFRRLAPAARVVATRKQTLPAETDPAVAGEWQGHIAPRRLV